MPLSKGAGMPEVESPTSSQPVMMYRQHAAPHDGVLVPELLQEVYPLTPRR